MHQGKFLDSRKYLKKFQNSSFKIKKWKTISKKMIKEMNINRGL